MSNLREEISNALNGFRAGNLVDNARVLLAALGYRSEKRADLVPNTAKNFVDTFGNGLSHVQFNHDNALIKQWKSVDLLFQLAEDDLNAQMRLQVSQGIDQSENAWQSYLFFAIALEDRDKPYSRSDLAKITREINKLFLMPVMVIFQHGQTLTLAVIDRRLSKKYSDRDVLEKVTLIKDISFTDTHTAHLHILEDLSQQEIQRKYKFNSFEDLHKAWRQVLNTSELNKRFYKDVSYWYFYACTQVKFPSGAKNNQDSLIRLITRLMFVWFLKEKKLVPDELFNERNVKAILKSLEPSESTYYKAILQNLFFATLNTEWGTRRFSAGDNGDQNHNEFLYESAFIDSQKTFKSYFEKIPFLNGGLFECLDRKVENEPEVIIDGFGDDASSELSVPNELFFGDPKDVDLNTEFGTKGRKYKVQGIIRIFDSYKFTVTENTPLEEEVALDPELLGQVFENLLAAYNPETQTTARKQTGSFYTPREIVNYMVDESLIAYLKNQLLTENVTFLEVGKRQTDIFGNEYKAGQLTIQEQLNQNPFKGKEDELEQKLRQLLSFDDANPFSGDNEVQERLIEALDSCKILDPACGSGAFPMGVLQKMVYILSKLDRLNVKWKQRQVDRIDRLIADAKSIEDEKTRTDTLANLELQKENLEWAFVHNGRDYGRKLFLIQNCIYGVDIQAIAVQIAKLRFFISLIIDQDEDHEQPNLGILPLPNLETKFVVADSLIGIAKTKQLSFSFVEPQEIQSKQIQLERLRSEHFFAKNPAEKRKKRNEDEKLCREIITIWQRHGKPDIETLQSWQPYNQNASANFFDAEWMFGIRDGFDIVIGNPPYGVSIKGTYRAKVLEFLDKVPDYEIYYFFIEVAYKIVADKGTLCYIVPNTYLFNVFAKDYRNKLINKWGIKSITDFTQFSLFGKATVRNSVFLMSKGSTTSKVNYLSTSNEHLSLDEFISQEMQILDVSLLKEFSQNWALAFKLPQNKINAIASIKKNAQPLNHYFPEISQGLIAYDKYQGQRQDIIESRAYHFNNFKDGLKKWLWGEDVRKYKVNWNGKEFIDYCNGIANPRQPKYFIGKRMLVREITNPSIFAAITNDEMYNDPSILIVLASAYSLEAATMILNSCVGTFFHFNAAPKATKGDFPKILVKDLKEFPLPKNFGNLRNDFWSTFYQIVLASEESKLGKINFSSVVDAACLNLYFPEHMKENAIEVLEFVERDIAEVTQGKKFEKLSDAEKEKVIDQLYAKWNHPDNEVHERIKLFAIRSPEILKPILESK